MKTDFDFFFFFPQVSKEGVSSQGVLHGNLQRDGHGSAGGPLEKEAPGSERRHECEFSTESTVGARLLAYL